MTKPDIGPEELPDPSAISTLVRVLVEAHLMTLPRKRAMAFLAAASTILATEESVALVFPIRPASRHAEVSKARREAIALWRQLLPTLLARVPPR